MKLLLFLVFFSLHSLSSAVGDSSPLDYAEDESFLEWCAEFCESKSDEYLARIYPTWRQNADYVRDSESAPRSLPYTLSLNQFAHLSLEEFSERYLRELKPPRQGTTRHIPYFHGRGDPPDSVDWRTKGVVPPVENQGQCASASAYGVVHAVDSFNAIRNGTLELASVEEYVDCCTDHSSCDGGIYGLENYACIVKIGGLALASVYVSPDHVCLSDKYKGTIKIDGGKLVEPSGSEKALEYAVAIGPVAAAMDASHASFQMYASGVYYDPDCSSTRLDHVVLVVGYGKTAAGEEYWICQNSWGTSWGMEGYFYLARNRGNNCGITTMATYPY